MRSIAAVKEAYETGDLRARLGKYHRDVDVAFWGWNRAWLDPEFRHWRIDEYLAYIRVPILIVQGEDDEYGTAAQVVLAQQETYCPVEVRMLPDANHAPQVDRPDPPVAGFPPADGRGVPVAAGPLGHLLNGQAVFLADLAQLVAQAPGRDVAPGALNSTSAPGWLQ